MQMISVQDPQAIPLACKALAKGELVIYPTETCYGIAADPTNRLAITKLLAYKGDRHRQVSIAVNSREMSEKYVDLNSIAVNLYTNFLPGPITVISTSRHLLDSRLESAAETLGVRFPKHEFALSLITAFGKPITATSANTSGKKEPYSLADWQKYTTQEKQNMVSLFLDAGKLEDRPTSTVVDTTTNDPTILRQGEIIVPSIEGQVFRSGSVEETRKIAREILQKHLPLTNKYPLIFALQGPLGVGKTHFTQGLAAHLLITANVNSPTYTLMKEYPYPTSGTDLNRNAQQGSTAVERTVPYVDVKYSGDLGSDFVGNPTKSNPNRCPKYSGILYHLDTWRLNNPAELEDTLHFSTLLVPHNIIVLEWPQKAKSILEQYKDESAIIYVDISETSDTSRTIKYDLSLPDWS